MNTQVCTKFDGWVIVKGSCRQNPVLVFRDALEQKGRYWCRGGCKAALHETVEAVDLVSAAVAGDVK